MVRRPLARPARRGAREPRHARSDLVSGRNPELRRSMRSPPRRRGPTTSRSSPPVRPAPPRCSPGPSSPDAVARCRAGLVRLGRAARRSRRRVPPQHPRDDRRVPGHREPRRGVVVVRAGVRRALGRRPLRADRAGGAARRRRVPLRREGGRQARPRSRRSKPRSRRCVTPCTCAYLGEPAPTTGPALLAERRASSSSSRSRSTIRCTCCSARARPGSRRRSCTATAASPSSTSRRWRCTTTSARATGSSGSPPPGWMMWNYLVSGLLVGATHRAVRRRSGVPRPRRAVAARRRHRASTCSA